MSHDALRRPLVVLHLDDYPVAVAGLRQLLAPHTHRIRLLLPGQVDGDSLRPDVVLFEPARISPETRDLLERLEADEQSLRVAYSWDDAGRRHQPFVSKSLGPLELVARLEELIRERRRTRHMRLGTALEEALGQRPGSDRTLEVPEAEWVAPASPTSAISPVGRVHRLSRREEQVLALVGHGLTNREIGIELFVSVNSVKTYIRAAYRKVGVNRRSQAVGWCVQHGLSPALLGQEVRQQIGTVAGGTAVDGASGLPLEPEAPSETA